MTSAEQVTGSGADALPLLDVVGAWTLVSADTAQDGAIVGNPFGTQPTGSSICTADGYVSALITGGDPLIAYAGPVEVGGSEVAHLIEVGVSPIDPGTTLTRRARFSGDGHPTLLAASIDTPGTEPALVWAPSRTGSADH